MATTITILTGTGDSAADGNNTFQGDVSATPGTITASDNTPTSIFESELEGISATTNISLASSIGITIADLTDNNLNLAQTAANSVTFTTGTFTMLGANDTITTGGGALNITATGGATISGLNANGGLITVTADDMALTGTTTGGSVTLQTATAGRAIDLGTNTAGTLGLTSAELNTITASGGTLTIGRNDASASGNITVTGNIAPTGASTLVLMTGGSITQAAGTVAETNLGLVAATGVTLTSAGNDVTALSGLVTGTGNFTYNDSSSFTVTGLAAVNATTTTGIQTTDGSIALQGTQVSLSANLLTNGTGGAASAVTITGPVVLAASTVTVDTDASGANGAGNVTFVNAIEGAAAATNTLIVDASDTSGGTGGAVTFGSAVGATTRLAGLAVKGTSVSFTGTSNVDTLAVALSGLGNAVSYTDADTLTVGTVGGVVGIATNGGAVTLTAGAITVNAALSTTAAVTLNSSGATTLGVAFSGIDSLTTDAAGTTAINGGSVTTTGAQSYNDAVTLGANTILTSNFSGAVTFDTTLDGAFGLTINTAGGTFLGIVGGTTALASLTTDTPGVTFVSNNITTTGAQSYNDQIALFGSVALTSTGSGNISFALVDNNFDLTVNTAGTTTFSGGVGSLAPLASVTTDAAGTTALNGGSVTTNGAQTYNDAVILGANTTLSSTGAGNLSFATTLNGPFSLLAETAGTTTFGGAIGGATALTSVTTDAAGTTAINGGSVVTTGAQTYNDAVMLGANTVLTSNTSGNLTLGSIVNGPFSLTANTAGTTTFGGAVGGITSVTTDAAGTTAINGGSVATSGAQTYNDAVTLGVATALTGTGINFASTLNNNGFGLTATESGTGQFSGVISGGGGFTKAGSGTTTLAAVNTYIGATTINAGTLLVNGSIASAAASVNATGTLGGSGTTGAVNVASGGTLSPGASAGILHTGGVTFVAGANFNAELGGTIAGSDYDRLSATGSVNLAGATLNGALLGSPVVGTSYTIITATGGVSGTFAGLADLATTYIGNRAFQIDYSANNVDLTLGALKLTGTDPVNILADVNTTIIDGSNATSPTQSVARNQVLNGDINGTVNAGVTVDGVGLIVISEKSGGAIDFTNNGAIVVSAATADTNPALFLIGNGGGVHYSGTGSLSTPNGGGLVIASVAGVGGSNLIEVGGAITGNFGIVTGDGTTNIVVAGAVTGTGGLAIVFDPTSFSNVVDLKPTAVISGNLLGSGNDDAVRLSGISGSGSFDLDQIGSGFSTLTKVEGSTWTVTGTLADTNVATTIVNGALLVNGTISGGVTVGTIFSEPLPIPPALLGGTGTVGNVLVQDKGILAPGVGAGTLTVTGNLTMSAGSILNIEIGGAGAGQFDVLNVNGTAVDTGAIELGAATLTGSLIGGFTPSLGQVFKIIDNAGSDAIGSPFNGISEGAGVNFAGRTFTVSYVGGDGNDVTLTAVANGAPGLTGVGPTANVTQAGPAATPQVLDGDVVFSDVEGNFAGGALIVSGLLAEDTVSVPSTGSDPGEFLIVENGAVDRLFFEGTEIGGISGGTGTTLNITFNGNATTGIIDTLVQNLTFVDTSANPTFSRTLVLNVMDSALASTGPKPLLVHVFNGDIAFGGAGDDSFAPTGNAHIDAGGGNDTITFDFRLVDATVTYSGNQVIIDAPSRHMVLSGFEAYKFTDGTVNNNDGDVLVDDLFYYSKYHDVWTAHADADAHYHTVGWKEGRDPDAFFSTVIYLSANPDVKTAGVDPLKHFDTSGWKEGRVPSINFDPAQYLAANPDVKAAGVDPLAHFLQFGAGEGRQPIAPTELVTPTGFDYVYYLNHNPDVAAAGVDPLQHFQTVGWKEGRNPNALFDTTGYLNNYLDVKAANVNPLDHYNQFGWHEGRDPSVGFDTTSYLAAYPDVNAAHINPLTHFLDLGIHEGRSPFADGLWG